MFGLPPLPRNVEAAFRDLESTKPEIRRGAILDVSRHGRDSTAVRQRAIAPLEQILMKDPHPAVRAASAVALADIQATEALPTLLLAVEDAHQDVRQFAIAALGEIEDDRAKPRIERALRDSRPDVRYQALIAWSRLASTDCLAAIEEALADEDSAVRYISLRIAEESMQNGDVLPERFRSRALACLTDADENVRLAAAIVLAKAGETEGRALVIRVVSTGRIGKRAPEREDEAECVELAGELGMKELTADLERRAFGLSRLFRETHSFGARIALARLGHKAAKQSIWKDLHSRNVEKRTAAVVSAGRAKMVEARDAILEARPTVDESLVEEALALINSSLRT